MRWNSQPLLDYLKEKYNVDLEELGDDPLQPLLDFLKEKFNFNWEAIKTDPDTKADEIAEVLERCIDVGALLEPFDGMTLKISCRAVIGALAEIG